MQGHFISKKGRELRGKGGMSGFFCAAMYARKGGCKGGKQQRGTSLDKYTNYSFSAEKLQSASATV